MPGLVWFGQLLDPLKKNFCKFFSKIRNSRNSQNFRMKTQLFPRHALPFFLLYSPITLVILHTPIGLIWTTPWPDAKEIFLKFSKFRNSRNSQNSVWKPNFFLGKLYQQLLLLYTLITLVILNTEFDLIWTTPWPAEKEFFFKFSKIRNSRNSHNSVWKPNFFLGKLYQQLFCFTLSLHWWYSITSLIWFGQLLDPMKKNYFWNSQKFTIREIRKIPYENFFFPRIAIPMTFWLYTFITLVILNTEFGLIWTTPWPDEKELFLKFSKIHNSRNSQNSVWKPFFWLAIPTTFLLYTLITLVILNTEFGLIWTTLWSAENEFFKSFFKNSQFAKFAKFRMKIQLFPRHALPKFFLLYTLITLLILNTEFGLIWTTP